MMYDAHEIRQYVRENWRFFGPDGLGWRSPSETIRHYQADALRFADDLYAVDYFRQREVELNDERGQVPKSYMDPETNRRIEAVRDLGRKGMEPAEIAAATGLNERGIRNVLRMGDAVYDHRAEPPETDPRIDALSNAFGMRSEA